jgi:ABC-2 type transport system permease protein
MHKLLAVIRREFVERVRTRAFMISTVLGPVFMAVLIFLPVILASRQTAAKRVTILDASAGTFGDRVERALRDARLGTGDAARPRYVIERLTAGDRLTALRDSLIARIGTRDADADTPVGVLLLTEDGLTSGKLDYLGENVSSPSDMAALESALEPVVLTERLVRENVDPEVVKRASGRVDLKTAKVSGGKLTGESGTSSFLLAYIMTFILYFALLMYGIQVMSSVLEEKTSRIMEVLTSSLTPFQLMMGKVLGVGSVGLFQLSIWAAASLYLTTNLAPILRLLHLPTDAASQSTIPSISPSLLALFLTFFVLGFFLYAALYAAVGAMCNSQQDTQQAQTPVMLGVIAGFMCMFPVLNEPNGTLAHVLSLIPFVAPFVTPLRFSVAPPPWSEIALSIVVTAVGVVAIVWVASRIYRVGILAYGKRPTFGELWTWLRTA